MNLIPPLISQGHVQAAVNGCLGLITLNRPQALNALTLPMIRDLTALLQHWEAHPVIQAVVVLGANREGKPPAFCAGGDIRFFYQAALAQDESLWDFFTEEYALVHRIHHYPKPYIALMDGIVMGGGMGISQGARLRVVNEHSKLAMPECHIGLFPDVGGGWFLGQCPGHTGEWLALTGQAIGAGDGINLGLADVYVPSAGWAGMVAALQMEPQASAEHVVATVMERAELAPEPRWLHERSGIDRCFSASTTAHITQALEAEATQAGTWASEALQSLQANSPLAMARTLELLRRARTLSLADELRLELDLVHRCFEPAWREAHSDTVEGIRALAIDKDQAPVWQPADVASVTVDQVARSFLSPWALSQHPLRALTP
ncbi:MAG: enoyl-CoA hydratase/isomerase family protein [Burkholderiales bacterium]|nr:enoyl-CoA hydratase/isomerase family protein [Burkholderiales bacterium]